MLDDSVLCMSHFFLKKTHECAVCAVAVLIVH